jgi:hypothetical protein
MPFIKGKFYWKRLSTTNVLAGVPGLWALLSRNRENLPIAPDTFQARTADPHGQMLAWKARPAIELNPMVALPPETREFAFDST